MSQCSGEYVARMDADDVSLPSRLSRQLQHLSANLEIDVLGTQAVRCTDDHLCLDDLENSTHLKDNNNNNNNNNNRSHNINNDSSNINNSNNNNYNNNNKKYKNSIVIKSLPTHPVLVSWEMLTRCCVIHPSVMFRKKAALDVGGYTHSLNREKDVNDDDDIYSKFIEDYHLWIRMLKHKPHCIGNLPDVLLKLSVNDLSKSRSSLEGSLKASYKLRLDYLSHISGIKISGENTNGLLWSKSKMDLQINLHGITTTQFDNVIETLNVSFDKYMYTNKFSIDKYIESVLIYSKKDIFNQFITHLIWLNKNKINENSETTADGSTGEQQSLKLENMLELCCKRYPTLCNKSDLLKLFIIMQDH